MTEAFREGFCGQRLTNRLGWWNEWPLDGAARAALILFLLLKTVDHILMQICLHCQLARTHWWNGELNGERNGEEVAVRLFRNANGLAER